MYSVSYQCGVEGKAGLCLRREPGAVTRRFLPDQPGESLFLQNMRVVSFSIRTLNSHSLITQVCRKLLLNITEQTMGIKRLWDKKEEGLSFSLKGI